MQPRFNTIMENCLITCFSVRVEFDSLSVVSVVPHVVEGNPLRPLLRSIRDVTGMSSGEWVGS